MKKNFKYLFSYLMKYNIIFRYFLHKVESYESLSQDEIDKIRLNKIKKLLKESQKTSFYRELYRDIDLSSIKSLADLKKLPIVTRDMIQGREEEILTHSPKFMSLGYTSGSTGEPLRVYYDYLNVLKENAYVWQYRERAGLSFKERKVSIRGDLSRDQIYSYDRYTNTLHLSSFNLNSKYIDQYYRLILDFEPKAILGYPSSLHILVLLLKEHSLKLTIPLGFTSSEKLYPYQRELIESYLDTKIFDWYGNAERSIALYQSDNGYFKEPILYSFNEYNRESITTTALLSSGYLLIRYRVNDLIKWENGEILEIVGRQEDYILLSDGTRVGRVVRIFKSVPNIKIGQIIQKKINEIDVNIVADEFSKDDEALLISNIDKILGGDIVYKITVVPKESIVYTARGKFKTVISKVV